MTEQGAPRAAATYVGLFLVYLLLSYLLLCPMSLSAHSRLPDDGDSLQGLWILHWGASHLTEGRDTLFGANAYYPHPMGLVYSEPMLSEALLALPLFQAFEGRVLVVNLLTFATLALSAVGFHWLARELTGSHVGAFLGALLYSFNSYVFSHLAQLQLVTVQWLPLALVCLHKFFTTKRVRSAVAFCCFSTLLGLGSFYYLAFFSLVLAILIPTYVVSHPLRGAGKSLLALLVFGAAGVVVVYWVAAPYLSIFEHYQMTGEPARLDLAAFFTPPSGSLVYGELAPFNLTSHFVGYFALGLAASGAISIHSVRPGRTRLIFVAFLVAGFVAFLSAAGPHLFLGGRYLGRGPFSLLQMTSPFEKLREPGRIAIIVYLVLGLHLALGVSRLLRGLSSARTVFAGAVIGCVLLAEQWSPVRTRGMDIPTGDLIPDVYYWLEKHEGDGPVAELPVRPFHQIRRTSMEAYFATFHGRPILFAKPSFYPPAMELLQWELRDFPDEASLALLQALQVRFAVVHPRRWPAGRALRLRRLDRLTPTLTLLKAFEDRDDALWREYQLGGERLYRIAPADGANPAGAPRACGCRRIEPDSYRVEASGTRSAELAVDGDRRTKWTTSGGQRKGDYFEITFDRPRRPLRVEIEMAFPYGEFPRNLEMNGYRGQRGYRVKQIADVAYTIELVRQLVAEPTSARLRYDFEPMTMDRLRLFINRTEEATIDWSIPEIHIFEADELRR